MSETITPNEAPADDVHLKQSMRKVALTALAGTSIESVSYTHLTLPTILLV